MGGIKIGPLKIGGKTAGLLGGAASIFGGPAGAAVGAGLGMLGGAEDQRNADRLTEQQRAYYQQIADMVHPYYQPALLALMQSGGFDPATGAFDLSRIGALTGEGANRDPTGEAAQQAVYSDAAIDASRGANQAAGLARAGARRSGIMGSTGLDNQIGQIYGGLSEDLGRTRTGLRVQGEREQYARRLTAEQEKQRRIQGIVSTLFGMGGTAANGMGGLAAGYNASAAGSAGGMADLFGTLAASGMLGGHPSQRPASAGDNTLGTNQAGAPFGGQVDQLGSIGGMGPQGLYPSAALPAKQRRGYLAY